MWLVVVSKTVIYFTDYLLEVTILERLNRNSETLKFCRKLELLMTVFGRMV